MKTLNGKLKERPIIMDGEAVRAILAGRKTQMRDAMEPQPSNFWQPPKSGLKHAQIGAIGDRLWVRETWVELWDWDQSKSNCPDWYDEEGNDMPGHIHYRADPSHPTEMADPDGAKVDLTWRPSVHMPRHASRITLEITNIRVERLQDISEADAMAEGVNSRLVVRNSSCHYIEPPTDTYSYIASYIPLWESANGKGSWDWNPWVWVIEFKKLEGDNA